MNPPRCPVCDRELRKAADRTTLPVIPSPGGGEPLWLPCPDHQSAGAMFDREEEDRTSPPLKYRKRGRYHS